MVFCCAAPDNTLESASPSASKVTMITNVIMSKLPCCFLAKLMFFILGDIRHMHLMANTYLFGVVKPHLRKHINNRAAL